MVMQNYAELESEVLQVAVQRTLLPADWMSYSDWVDHTFLFNRRLMNLLATVKLYEDHAKREVSKALGIKRKTVHELFQEYREAREDFAFLCNLRDHAQHFALPIQQFEFNSSWEESPKRLVKTISIILDAESIQEDNRRQWPDEVTKTKSPRLEPLLRGAIEALARIHDDLKRRTKEQREHATALASKWLASFENSGDGLKFFTAVEGSAPTNGVIANVQQRFLVTQELVNRVARSGYVGTVAPTFRDWRIMS